MLEVCSSYQKRNAPIYRSRHSYKAFNNLEQETVLNTKITWPIHITQTYLKICEDIWNQYLDRHR